MAMCVRVFTIVESVVLGEMGLYDFMINGRFLQMAWLLGDPISERRKPAERLPPSTKAIDGKIYSVAWKIRTPPSYQGHGKPLFLYAFQLLHRNGKTHSKLHGHYFTLPKHRPQNIKRNRNCAVWKIRTSCIMKSYIYLSSSFCICYAAE